MLRTKNRLWEVRGLAPTILAAIVLVGLSLRMPLLIRYDFNPDEILQLLRSSHSLTDIIHESRWEAYPPLADIIRHYMLAISESVTFQRLFGLIPGIAQILVSYRLGQCIRDKALGLAIAALTAISPACILLSQVSRSYMLLVL